MHGTTNIKFVGFFHFQVDRIPPFEEFIHSTPSRPTLPQKNPDINVTLERPVSG